MTNINKRKVSIRIIAILLVIILGGFFYVKTIIYSGFNIKKPVYIYVSDKTSYNDLLQELNDSAHIDYTAYFEQVAKVLKYNENTMRTGRYKVTPSTTVLELVRHLRGGAQAPLALTFNNVRTKEQLAERIGNQMMFGKNSLYTALSDSITCSQLGFNTTSIVSMFIPNTYQMYWNMSLEAFLKRMQAEYKSFWTTARLEKAKEVGLSPQEVSILASIVEEECMYADEYPVVAGLYINRLKRGQLLQADPTVKYAVGDFTLKRILNKHIATKSPYNTYQNKGLPPGPIRIPSVQGIDAVLNYADHSYLYMCAKEDFSGRHNFARTLAEHNRNAARYHAALNTRQIY